MDESDRVEDKASPESLRKAADHVAVEDWVARLLRDAALRIEELESEAALQWTSLPVPMLLWCPLCHARHIDEGEFATKPHTSHACQSCGLKWGPAKVPTVGVQFLPGYKNGAGT